MPRVDLTKASAIKRALDDVPEQPEVFLWHTGAPKGFGLRVRNGRTDWIFQYRVRGTRTQRRMTFGQYGVGGGGLVIAVAHQMAAEAYLSVVRGKDPNPRVITHEPQSPRKRKGIGDKLRFRLLKRDGFRCVYCGQGFDTVRRPVVDHITPVALGGRTIELNLVTACEPCNSGKAAEPLSEAFASRLKARIAIAGNPDHYSGMDVDDLVALWSEMNEGL